MKYESTRGEKVEFSSTVIAKGIASDGGLYVPESFPKLTEEDFNLLATMEYYERSAYILGKYLTDYSEDELLDYAKKAYARFDGEPAPLVKVDDCTFFMELWHGPTLAFKDIALTILPYLLTGARKKNDVDKKTLILVATSGDTGKAALEGFRDVEGTEIVVFYPSTGVSEMQKLQMQTTEGKNVHVVGIDGNFDDAQTAVKTIFADEEMRSKLSDMGYTLSSANSINFGRLAPQIVYYVSAYVDLLSAEEIPDGEAVNFVVPSGNFGNILAGYYAMQMGVPIKHLIVASNKNNILTDFFETGEYDTNREFFKTISPSMDILVSSNLERLLYEMGDRDPEFVKDLMKKLKETGSYTVDEDLLYEKFAQFIGYDSTEEETNETMDNLLDEYGYLVDPHTAVGATAYFKYLSDLSDDDTTTVIVSTANAYKFPQDVLRAVAKGAEEPDPFKAVKKLEFASGIEAPESIAALKNKPILHSMVIGKQEIKDRLLEILAEDK